MGTCENCGNEYERTFDVVMNGTTHTFDSFECAIQALAPVCAQCGTKIVGHGVESPDNTIFCCANCARAYGAIQVAA